MLRTARPLSIVALVCALAGLAALLVFLVAPLWGFCPAEGPAGTCPQTATLSTLLAVDPLAGRLLVAATLLPVIIAVLVLTARWTSLVVRVLVWIATATLAVVLIWALLAHQPAALLVLPAFVAALLIALLVARRPLAGASV